MSKIAMAQNSNRNSTDSKIVPLAALAKLVSGHKSQGKRLVHCHGVFDLVHPGHIRHLEEAKRQGDVLAVTVTPDEYVNKGPGRPVFNQRLRSESVAALQCVDYVAINEWPTAVETVRLLRPDVYVKGPDYAQRESDPTGRKQPFSPWVEEFTLLTISPLALHTSLIAI